jgi:hypothetical protein
VFAHWRGPFFLYRVEKVDCNKKAKRIEETNKVKRRFYFVKQEIFAEAKPSQPQICADPRR